MSITTATRSSVDAQRLLFPQLAGFYAVMKPISCTIMRVGVCFAIFTHGWPKVAHINHGSMTDPYGLVTGLIKAKMNLPFPSLWTDLLGYLETAGAVALGLGLFTRILAPAFAVEMAIICLLLGPNWPWIDRGIEYPFVLGVLMLYLSFEGGGRYSLDHMIGREV